jgi:hypothetical protein
MSFTENVLGEPCPYNSNLCRHLLNSQTILVREKFLFFEAQERRDSSARSVPWNNKLMDYGITGGM